MNPILGENAKTCEHLVWNSSDCRFWTFRWGPQVPCRTVATIDGQKNQTPKRRTWTWSDTWVCAEGFWMLPQSQNLNLLSLPNLDLEHCLGSSWPETSLHVSATIVTMQLSGNAKCERLGARKACQRKVAKKKSFPRSVLHPVYIATHTYTQFSPVFLTNEKTRVVSTTEKSANTRTPLYSHNAWIFKAVKEFSDHRIRERVRKYRVELLLSFT